MIALNNNGHRPVGKRRVRGGVTKNRICFLVWGFQPFPPHPGAPVRGTPSPEVTQALPSREGYRRGRQYRLPMSGPWRGGTELLASLIVTSVSPPPEGAE